MYMHKYKDVQRTHFLGNLAAILMIYISPSEVFQVLSCLVKSSEKIKKEGPEEMKYLRWHIPHDEDDHA